MEGPGATAPQSPDRPVSGAQTDDDWPRWFQVVAEDAEETRAQPVVRMIHMCYST